MPITQHSRGRSDFAYSTVSRRKHHFTVISSANVYRVNAYDEAEVRTAFAHAGLAVVAVDRDEEDFEVPE